MSRSRRWHLLCDVASREQVHCCSMPSDRTGPGAAMMGIVVAVLIIAGLNAQLDLGLAALDVVSLAALLAVTGLLAWQALRR